MLLTGGVKRYQKDILAKLASWLRRNNKSGDGGMMIAFRDVNQAVARIVEVTLSAASIGGSGLITTEMQDHFDTVVHLLYMRCNLCRFPPSLIRISTRGMIMSFAL